MFSQKELWLQAWEDVFNEAVDRGMDEHAASVYADANVQDVFEDAMVDRGDWLFEQQKDRGMFQ